MTLSRLFPLLFLVSLTWAWAPVHARAWRGIDPGKSRREDIVRAFGEPSKALTLNGKEVLAYYARNAIKGTSQVQFKVNPVSGTVERIDVFPGPVIDKAAVEGSYGPACTTKSNPAPCYTARIDGQGQLRFRYATVGMLVFFNPDGTTVQSFVFLPDLGSEPPSEPASPPPPSSPPTPSAEPEATEGSSFPDAFGESSSDSSPTQVEGVFGSTPELEDPLKIGGEMYLRGQASVSQLNGQRVTTYSSPSLVDMYLDGTPNERLRAMVSGRLTYDFTQAAGTRVVLPGATPPVVASNPGVLLDQLWLRFDLARTVFFTVGKQKVKWGASQLWNPTDFLSPQQRDLLNAYDTRIGTDLLKLHIPWERMGWNFYAVALLDRSSQDAEDPLKGGGALRAEMLIAGAEISVSGVLREGRRPRVGMDFSAPLGPFDIYAEAAAQRGTDTPILRPRSTVEEGSSFLEGFERETLDSWIPSASGGLMLILKVTDRDTLTFAAEYFYNGTGYTDPQVLPALILENRYQAYYAGQQYAALTGRLDLSNGLDTHAYSLTALTNLSDHSYVVRGGAYFTLLTQLTLELFGSVPFGTQGGEFRPEFNIPPQLAVDGTVLQPGLVVPGLQFDLGIGLRLRI